MQRADTSKRRPPAEGDADATPPQQRSCVTRSGFCTPRVEAGARPAAHEAAVTLSRFMPAGLVAGCSAVNDVVHLRYHRLTGVSSELGHDRD